MTTNFCLYHHFLNSFHRYQQLSNIFKSPHPYLFIAMKPPLSLASPATERGVIQGEDLSEQNSPSRNSTSAVLNSVQLSGAMARETHTFSFVNSPEPHFVTIESDSNELTIPYVFGKQHPIVPSSLNDLNLTPNQFKVLATMAVIQTDEEYSPQLPEPSNPSPISTPPMNLSTIEGWETPHTSTDGYTFHSDDEPTRIYWDILSSESFDSNEPRQASITSSPSSTPALLRQQKIKPSKEMFFQETGDCRSTPATHAASPYQQERHSNAQEKLKHYYF